MVKLDETDLEGMREFFKNRMIRFPNAAEEALKKLNLNYLPDIDEEEKKIIEDRKHYAKFSMDDWRFWHSLWEATLRLREETEDQKAFEEYTKLLDEISNEEVTALKEAKDANLEADTIEKYGLKAHQGLRSKEARWHLLQESMIEESLLKYSMFVIVPFVAYVLLSKIK
jgi:hypothetical protein